MEQHQLNQFLVEFRKTNERLDRIVELLEKIAENQPEKPKTTWEGPIVSHPPPTRDSTVYPYWREE